MRAPARRLSVLIMVLGMLGSLAPASVLASVAPTKPTEASASFNNPGPGVVANETGAPGLDIYIVRHQAPSLAQYRGGVDGLAPTSPDATGDVRLDPNSGASRAYLAYLDGLHDGLIAAIQTALGRNVEVTNRYAAVYNGIALRMTAGEAAQVSSLPGVRRVTRNYARELLTDAGPEWIGANAVWGENPPAGNTPCVGNCGEGVVAGIIDTGINTDHPSFADVGGDGYNHTNPRLIYLGLCAPVTGLPFCNDKLIGVYDFTGTGPEDGIGHGSHTASTTAGNVVTAEMVGPTITLTRDISGVAPHANIISYKACQEVTGNCLINGILASINQATLDVVDVINYSIGGASANPWVDDDAQAFADAHAAGIFVAASAGNEGPGFGTHGSPADAPWVTGVGASTHDRKLANGLVDMTGGTNPPADIEGAGITSGYGPARIVYAGDYAAQSNDPANAHLCGSGVGDPATGQGSGGDPWPAGTFNGEIVVCERGEYGRVMKGEYVRRAGAGGYVLMNDEANGDSLIADAYTLPGVHISHSDGQAVKAWIAANGGAAHTGTARIRGMNPEESPAFGDVMASFSSRGANPAVPGVIKPDVTAPGVDILAAFHSPLGTVPGGPPEYNVISGTSMSSPHTAGAGALLRAVHPDWTPDQVKSALMSVAFTTLPGTGSEVHGVLKEDAATPADPFDMGAGRVDLRQSPVVGFTLDETTLNYEAANPGLGGDATTLNMASLGQDNCPSTCTWTRTLTGTAPGTVSWTSSFSAPSGMTISVSPSSFSLANGQQQTLTITADVGGVSPKGQWTFAEVQFSPGRPSVPSAHFPVAIIPAGGQPPVTLHFHGNIHDDCTGDGAADLETGEGICTPFLGNDVLDDTGAPAAHWGPINTALDCTVDRCLSDPNWIWELTEPTTLQGPMTVEWWYGGIGDNPLLFDDFEIRLYADGTEVLREVVRHTGTAPNVPHLLRSTVNVPLTTATGNFVLVIDPIFVNQNGSFIYYDSEQACPGLVGGPACDSRVNMPVVADSQPQPPTAVDDSAFVLTGGTVDIDVLANDSDPEGGPLAVEIVTPPTNGTASVTLAQTIRYTHDGSATTSDSLVYRITDNQGLTDTATVSITISDECLVPSGSYSDDFESGAPGWVVDTSVLTPPSQSWVLLSPDPFATSPTTVWFTDANAQDPQADTSKDVRLVSPAQHVSAFTHLTFFHRFNTEVGFDGGVLEVSTNNGTTWVDVLDAGGVFDAGAYGDTAAAGSGFVLSGREMWGGLSDGFLTGDMNLTDVDLAALAGETIKVRFRFGQDQLSPQPAGGWWIDDVAFTNLFEPCEGTQAPIANDDADTVAAGGSVNTDVKANDSDPDTANADLDVTIETDPTHGGAVVQGDGTVMYTHNGDTATSDSYQYRITDPDGGFDVATVSITIEQDNATPDAVDDSGSVAAGGSTTIDVKANDSDVDHTNDQLTVTIEAEPSHGAAGVNAEGTVTYTHNGDDATSDSFEYRLTDPAGAFDIATVSITINHPTDDDVRTTTGGGYLLTPEGDKLNFSLNVSEEADGSFHGTLKYNDKSDGVKIHLTTVLTFSTLEGECGTVLPGPGSVEFTGTGTHNRTDASFRVCVADFGEAGSGSSATPDMFHLECTAGCAYDTLSRVDDEQLDGGNIQVRNPGAEAGVPAADESSPESTEPTASTLILDPVLLTEGQIGAIQELTVRAFGPDQAALAGAAVSIHVLDASGTLLDTLTGVSDATGLVTVSVVIGAGEREFLAFSDSLSSNAIAVTGRLPSGIGGVMEGRLA
jgi:subtilisin family serine protease